MMLNNQSLATHILLDLHDCDVAILGNVAALEQALLQAAYAVQATVLFQHFHHFGGEGGVTGVLLLAESHISIHTWTECAFAAADIFVCGQSGDLQQACEILIQALQAQHFDLSKQNRGHYFSVEN